jgi:flagellar hook protein FlgE
MLTEQRAHQGTAMFVSTVNQMMQSLIQMVQ